MFKNIFQMKSKKNFAGRFFLMCMLALSLVTISGCDKDDDETPAPSGPPANEVWMQNTAFNPSSITVSAGTTITWRNKDNIAHTATSNTGAFDSGNVNGGGTFSHQFNTA